MVSFIYDGSHLYMMVSFIYYGSHLYMMGLICELQLPFVCDGSHLQSNLFQHSNYYSHMTQSHMTKPHYHAYASMATPCSQYAKHL